MSTIVINLNLIDSRELEEGDEYIGREHESRGLKASIFANPFPLTAKTNREEVLLNYYGWLWQQIQNYQISRNKLNILTHLDCECYSNGQEQVVFV